MIRCCTMRVSMLSQSRNWSSTRHWGGNSALSKWHMQRAVLVWIRHWRGAVSCAVCQFRIVGSVHFPPVPRLKSLRTPNKSGLWPEVNGWFGLYNVVDKRRFRSSIVRGGWEWFSTSHQRSKSHSDNLRRKNATVSH